MTTREMILRSWWASEKIADQDGALRLTAASFAGYALMAADGNVSEARKLIPTGSDLSFWARVSDALDQVAQEEALPGLAVVGSR